MDIQNSSSFIHYLLQFEAEIEPNDILILTIFKHVDNIPLIKDYANKLKTINRTITTREQIKKLLRLGYLEKVYDYEDETLDIKLTNFKVTDKYLNIITINIDKSFEELLENYPNGILIDSLQGDSKIVSSKNLNIEDYKIKYHQIIKGDKLKHYEIIEIIQDYNKYFKYAPITLQKFIDSYGWNNMKFLIEEKLKQKTNKDSNDNIFSEFS